MEKAIIYTPHGGGFTLREGTFGFNVFQTGVYYMAGLDGHCFLRAGEIYTREEVIKLIDEFKELSENQNEKKEN
jgi:hypothetical protein